MISFTEYLLEGRKWEFQGSTYLTSFGKYYKDGKQISKDEYSKASELYKNKSNSDKKSLTVTKDTTDKEENNKQVEKDTDLLNLGVKSRYGLKKKASLAYDTLDDFKKNMRESFFKNKKSYLNTNYYFDIKETGNKILLGDKKYGDKYKDTITKYQNNINTATKMLDDIIAVQKTMSYLKQGASLSTQTKDKLTKVFNSYGGKDVHEFLTNVFNRMKEMDKENKEFKIDIETMIYNKENGK